MVVLPQPQPSYQDDELSLWLSLGTCSQGFFRQDPRMTCSIFIYLFLYLVWPAVKPKHFCNCRLMPAALPWSCKHRRSYLCSCKLADTSRKQPDCSVWLWHQGSNLLVWIVSLFLELHEDIWTVNSDLLYGRQAKAIPASPLFCSHHLVLMQRCCSVPAYDWVQQASV